MGIISIEKSLELIKKGKMVILVDDENRENEGDLFVPAEKVTPKQLHLWQLTEGDLYAFQ